MEKLEDVMLSTVSAFTLPYPEAIISMHDSCLMHTVRVGRTRFLEQRHIELLHWPRNSPDLNSIENVWANIVNVWEPNEERTSQLYCWLTA